MVEQHGEKHLPSAEHCHWFQSKEDINGKFDLLFQKLDEKTREANELNTKLARMEVDLRHVVREQTAANRALFGDVQQQGLIEAVRTLTNKLNPLVESLTTNKMKLLWGLLVLLFSATIGALVHYVFTKLGNPFLGGK